jgi:hypothetical protein
MYPQYLAMQYLTDLNMLVNVGGRERTLDDFARLCGAASFRLDSVTPLLPPPRCLLASRSVSEHRRIDGLGERTTSQGKVAAGESTCCQAATTTAPGTQCLVSNERRDRRRPFVCQHSGGAHRHQGIVSHGYATEVEVAADLIDDMSMTAERYPAETLLHVTTGLRNVDTRPYRHRW